MRCSIKDLKRPLQVLIELENGGDVAAAIAVVGRRPDCHKLLIEHPLEALHDELVRAADEVDIVRVVELAHNVGAEDIACERATGREWKEGGGLSRPNNS